MGKSSAIAHDFPTKPLLRLLRLARTEVLLRPSHPGEFDLLRGEDEAVLGRVPEALLQHALAQGLVRRDGERLAATQQAQAFLRRALSKTADEAFAAQHGELADDVVMEPAGARMVRRNLDDSPLSSLSRLRDKAGAAYFPADALDAGERLASDFERGHLQPRVTASWEPKLAQKQKGQRPVGVDLSDSALAARNRVTKALLALGPELSGVALDVCCFAKGLEIVERERQWPARSAKLMLRTALMALARHYAPESPQASSALRHWGEMDYRPEMGKMAG
ncbi:DUF6456 domain-containing protein [Rhizobium sp.]|jgi:hypothetical protein|uniref:DUF6456 domain-containing protein n=1 Tax=Rhizobium sp. TaxID=391 RepID=UPI000E9E0174|nr:hypothetical protein [Rhizobium sp.]